MKRVVALIAILLMVLGCRHHESPTTVLIVRHAEKMPNGGDDPHLSDAGVARAKALAAVAEHAGVESVYVTRYQRTKETASQLGRPMVTLPVDLSNPAPYVKELAASIVAHSAGKVVLVVSHSNAVPAIVEALAHVKVPPIGDAEYDRLYVVTLPANGAPRVVAARYGECHSPAR